MKERDASSGQKLLALLTAIHLDETFETALKHLDETADYTKWDQLVENWRTRQIEVRLHAGEEPGVMVGHCKIPWPEKVLVGVDDQEPILYSNMQAALGFVGFAFMAGAQKVTVQSGDTVKKVTVGWLHEIMKVAEAICNEYPESMCDDPDIGHEVKRLREQVEITLNRILGELREEAAKRGVQEVQEPEYEQ